MSEIERKAQHWEVIAEVVRDVDRAHRGGDGPGMHDDDIVDVVAKALRDFPGLVKQRDHLQAILDAETGRKAPDGWEWDAGEGVWKLRIEDGMERAHVYGRCRGRYELTTQRGVVVTTTVHPCKSALDGFAFVAALGWT